MIAVQLEEGLHDDAEAQIELLTGELQHVYVYYVHIHHMYTMYIYIIGIVCIHTFLWQFIYVCIYTYI